jgi:hypothetical protein
MKTNFRTLVISGFLTATFALTTSCEKEMMNSDNAQYASMLDVSTDGTSTMISQNMQSAFVQTSDLTEAESATLVKMKNEERLARDVYSALYQKWGRTVFSRISSAENNHLNAIVRLLQNYGVADTLIGDAGTFTDVEVQTLYNTLIAKGSESIEEAYKTGALIEEMDIKDLSDALVATSNANFTMVFENLEKGSRNHLRSFYNQLTTLGVVYTPVYISQADYDQIVSSSMEKGKQYKMKGKGNGNCDGSGQGKRKGKN